MQPQVNYPEKIVELYSRFYLAKSKFQPSARGAIKPFCLATQIIVNADPSLEGRGLVNAIAGRLAKLMQQCHSGTAEGYYVILDASQERQAILEFAEYLVYELFEKAFNGDRARLQGRQLGYLEDACEFIYRTRQDEKAKCLN